jgi:hypothetical protein
VAVLALPSEDEAGRNSSESAGVVGALLLSLADSEGLTSAERCALDLERAARMAWCSAWTESGVNDEGEEGGEAVVVAAISPVFPRSRAAVVGANSSSLMSGRAGASSSSMERSSGGGFELCALWETERKECSEMSEAGREPGWVVKEAEWESEGTVE